MQIKKLSYEKSGVSILKADKFITKIKPLAKSTLQKNVRAGIGGFAALYDLPLYRYQRPVLVSSTDGVGTKLKIAFMAGRHNTVGIDLVAMSINDILTVGAKPLFFLDYYATGGLNVQSSVEVVKGIVKGCRISNCALIGGETAEMPGFYHDKEYDLAGFAVGIVEKNKIVNGSKIKKGHVLIGLPSSGLHSNGYSLVRKIIFEKLKLKISSYVPELKKSLKDELLIPTRIYSPLILSLLQKSPIHGMAHITGGGFTENIKRILPKGLGVKIYKRSWPTPKIFQFLQHHGNLSDSEMFKTFNCGIGYILIVPKNSASNITSYLNRKNEKYFVIGEVIKSSRQDVIYE